MACHGGGVNNTSAMQTIFFWGGGGSSAYVSIIAAHFNWGCRFGGWMGVARVESALDGLGLT